MHATAIDAGFVTAVIDGAGYSAEDSGWFDNSRTVVEFRDATGTVLFSYQSGNARPTHQWVPFGATPAVLPSTRTVRFRLITDRGVGSSTDGYHDDLSLELQGTATSAPLLSLRPWLGAAHPSPFNPRTTIPFFLPMRQHVRMDIYDVAGRQVTTLIDQVRDAGRHYVVWDGRSRGSDVPSGVYHYRMSTASATFSGRMVLVR